MRTAKNTIGYCFLFLLLTIPITVHFLTGYLGDKNWLLNAARMWLGGKKLYVDIFESNPPLIIWLYSVPSFISLHLHFIEDYQAMVLLGLCIIALSIFMSTSLIKRHPEFAGNKYKQALFATLLGYVLIFWTDPLYFLDREHLFLTLIFPYFLRWMPTLAHQKFSRKMTIAIGVMAGIGFCIKPHCLLVFIGLQIIYWLRERSLVILSSLENIIIYILGSCYLAAIWFFAPEYIFIVLPMAFATYSGFSHREGGFYFLSITAFNAATTFVDFRLRYTSPYRKDLFYFIAVAGFFLLYALINNGWGYTYNPLTTMVHFMTGWVCWEFLYLYEHDKFKTPLFIFGARACGLTMVANTLIILFSAYLTFTTECQSNRCNFAQKLSDVVVTEHAHSFGTIAVFFDVWPAVMRSTGAILETRFNHLWMMPTLVTSPPSFRKDHEWIVKYVSNALTEDLNHNKPEVMFVDATPKFYRTNVHVDLVKYFSDYPAFAAAWTHYRYSRTIDFCPKDDELAKMSKSSASAAQVECRYDIYKRLD